MLEFWKSLDFKNRILLMLIAGTALIAVQLFYYHFLFLIGGMSLIIISFFSLEKAPHTIYNPSQKVQLFFIPMGVGLLGGIIGYLLLWNMLGLVGSIILSMGLFSMLYRKILLNFNGYKVYEGIYAIIAGSIFAVLGGFILLMLYQR